ncbi:MAG: IS4/Tn5 family transposase DNA-binding protein [Acetobacteraceae bacterium]
MDGAESAWIDRELAGCSLADERLDKLLAQVGGAVGESILLACQEWANTKAAYRFFSNGRVTEAEILAGHFRSTQERLAVADGPVFMLHDTTEFSYQRGAPRAIGITNNVRSGGGKPGRPHTHTVCGILMHSSLAVMREGMPLRLAAVKFWTRRKFKGTAALKRRVNPTRVPWRSRQRRPSPHRPVRSLRSRLRVSSRESKICSFRLPACDWGPTVADGR